MVDVNKVMIAALTEALAEAEPAIAIYAIRLAPLYAAASPALVVSVQGGSSHAEITGLLEARVQLTAWANTPVNARAAYGLAWDAIHQKQNTNYEDAGFLNSCLEVVVGQDIVDPETGWAMVVGFFNVIVRPAN